jgi:squalene-associated FAD-dependent desaturase
MTPRNVTVVGGGLAGITAALSLADAGCEVTVLEAKPRIGGLTTSFQRDGLSVDNGQHVFMRCCTSYRALLDRLGVTDLTELQPRLDVPVVRVADGRRGRISRDPLPVFAGVPLHLGRSLGSYSLLPVGARLAAARAALALRRLDPSDAAVDAVAFGEWLREHGQPPAAVDALWDLVGVATLNAPADEASLALAATVFQIGLLTEPGNADLGWSTVPLQELHAQAAERAFARAGIRCRTSVKVRAMTRTRGGWRLATDDGDQVADAVVVATTPQIAEGLLPAGVAGAPGWSQRLGASPIVNVHAVFDRRVMREAFLACVGSPLQWVFDRSGPAGLSGSGQYVAASVSAAAAVIDVPVATLREQFAPEFARVFPAARDAELLDFFVTREREATFRQAPGSAASRPATTTALPGVVLAGAYVATGWPATMESAVRSGEAVAKALLDTPSPRLREDAAA